MKMEDGESEPHAVIFMWSLFVICDEICDQTGLQCHERRSCLWNWRLLDVLICIRLCISTMFVCLCAMNLYEMIRRCGIT